MACTHVTIGESWKCPACHREELSTLRSRLAEKEAKVVALNANLELINDEVVWRSAEIKSLKAEVEKYEGAVARALMEKQIYKDERDLARKELADLRKDGMNMPGMSRLEAQEEINKLTRQISFWKERCGPLELKEYGLRQQLKEAREALGRIADACNRQCASCREVLCPNFIDDGQMPPSPAGGGLPLSSQQAIKDFHNGDKSSGEGK